MEKSKNLKDNLSNYTIRRKKIFIAWKSKLRLKKKEESSKNSK
jgi:hypothetical protein